MFLKLLFVLLLALLEQTLWLASLCRRRYCAILSQLLKLELMLLLALLFIALLACSKGPWCACKSLFLEPGLVQLLANFVLANW